MLCVLCVVETVSGFPDTVSIFDSNFPKFLFWDESFTFFTGFLHQVLASKCGPLLIVSYCFENFSQPVEDSGWPGLLF